MKMSNNNSQNNNPSQKPKNIQPKRETRVCNDSAKWITEKCGTNNPPVNPPSKPSSGNKKK